MPAISTVPLVRSHLWPAPAPERMTRPPLGQGCCRERCRGRRCRPGLPPSSWRPLQLREERGTQAQQQRVCVRTVVFVSWLFPLPRMQTPLTPRTHPPTPPPARPPCSTPRACATELVVTASSGMLSSLVTEPYTDSATPTDARGAAPGSRPTYAVDTRPATGSAASVASVGSAMARISSSMASGSAGGRRGGGGGGGGGGSTSASGGCCCREAPCSPSSLPSDLQLAGLTRAACKQARLFLQTAAAAAETAGAAATGCFAGGSMVVALDFDCNSSLRRKQMPAGFRGGAPRRCGDQAIIAGHTASCEPPI